MADCERNTNSNEEGDTREGTSCLRLFWSLCTCRHCGGNVTAGTRRYAETTNSVHSDQGGMGNSQTHIHVSTAAPRNELSDFHDERGYTNERFKNILHKHKVENERDYIRLLAVERERNEEMLRKATEETQRKLDEQKRVNREMNKKMNDLQETLERLAKENRTNVEVRLKQAEDEFQSKSDKERLVMMKTMSELQTEVERLRCVTKDTRSYNPPIWEPVQAEHYRDEWAGKPSIEKPLQAEYFKDIVPRTCLENELRLVLVGKTGVGKSETANTIAGDELFISNASTSSVTKTCKQKTFSRDGQNLQLIDVPGFVDTHMTPELIKEEVVKCVALSHPGLHAILFVVEIGRFTNDDINTIEQFCNCFGKEALEFVIVIFTKVDSLIRKGNTLKGFIDNAPGTLKDLLAKTNYRFLGVNNWSHDKTEKEKFVKQLLDMVSLLVKDNGDKCFTNEMYRLAEKKLRENVEKEKKRLEELKRKEEERILKKANEKFQRELEKKNQEKMELEREMNARQEKLERKAEIERRKDEEKLKQQKGGIPTEDRERKK